MSEAITPDMREAIVRDVLLLLTTYLMSGSDKEAVLGACNKAIQLVPDLIAVDPPEGYDHPTPVMEEYLKLKKEDPAFKAFFEAQKTHAWGFVAGQAVCQRCQLVSTAGTGDRTPRTCPGSLMREPVLQDRGV